MSTQVSSAVADALALELSRVEERRARDRELFAEFQATGFEGPAYEMFRQRLWLYGWNVLRSWMKDGTVIARCRKRNIYFKAPYTEVEEMMRRAEVREDIAIDCLSRAVPYYLSDCLQQWDPEGGRNLTTFFMPIALHHFRDAYQRWAREYRRRLYELSGNSLYRTDDDGFTVWSPPVVPGPEEQTVLRETLILILAKASLDERAVCEAMLTGATQEEIAQKLGTTRKSVERRLSRVRRRARTLAADGRIVVPSVSSAVTR
ncbi:hypothetical protein ABZ027_31900 [Streptomyces sp. NPDC006332]|uniref:hypothetical protein n=1 Tax=Streptomyces sp. NPDC006332 TaxID=3155456 RepID=UPI0033BB16A4